MPEWPKGADCKSAGSAYVGSNPTPATHVVTDSFDRARTQAIVRLASAVTAPAANGASIGTRFASEPTDSNEPALPTDPIDSTSTAH